MAMPRCPKCGGSSFTGMGWGLSDNSPGATTAYPFMLGCAMCGTPVGTYISPKFFEDMMAKIDKIAKKVGA